MSSLKWYSMKDTANQSLLHVHHSSSLLESFWIQSKMRISSCLPQNLLGLNLKMILETMSVTKLSYSTSLAIDFVASRNSKHLNFQKNYCCLIFHQQQVHVLSDFIIKATSQSPVVFRILLTIITFAKSVVMLVTTFKFVAVIVLPRLMLKSTLILLQIKFQPFQAHGF